MALARARARHRAGLEEALRGSWYKIEMADIEGARETRAFRHGREEHYDLISALIKSLRGSDPDAGLYWMARLIEAGEDPRYVARRLVILASEDVGMADPHSLGNRDGSRPGRRVRWAPGAGLNLAQAVVHLALAPKSNRSALGMVGGPSRCPRASLGTGARRSSRRALPGGCHARPRRGLRVSSR